MKVIITSASKIEPGALSPLKKAIIKKYGGVDFELRIDQRVIGGVRVVIGSQAIDMTIAGRLSQVKKQLLSQL